MYRPRRPTRLASHKHSRSISCPESLNLSLLSFSCSLSSVPSLASASITTSLSTVSFPENISRSQSPIPSFIPLDNNLLLPASNKRQDGFSSNHSRATIAAPTLPRLKNMVKQAPRVRSWVRNLPDGAQVPDHVPWTSVKSPKPLEWIPEGSMYPPALYSKAIMDIHSRNASYEPDTATRKTVTPPKRYVDSRRTADAPPPRHPKPSSLPTKPAPKREPLAKTAPLRASDRTTHVKPPWSPSGYVATEPGLKPELIVKTPLRQDVVAERQNSRGGTTKIPHPHRNVFVHRHPASAKRRSIATADMINALRDQAAALTLATPPPDKLVHRVETPPSPVIEEESAVRLRRRAPLGVDLPRVEDDFGINLSKIYPTASAASMGKHEPFSQIDHLDRKCSINSSSDSLAGTCCNSETNAGDHDASQQTIDLRRRHLSRMFKRPNLSSSKSQPDTRTFFSSSVSLTRKRSVTFVDEEIVLDAPKKEVRFGPLPTTIRRYPAGPSADSSNSDTEDEDIKSPKSFQLRTVPTRRPKPHSPWLPQLETELIPAVIKGPSSRSTLVTASAPVVLLVPAPVRPSAMKAPKSQSLSGNGATIGPLIEETGSAQRPPLTKQSFARRSLSKIMLKPDACDALETKHASSGLTNLKRQWSLDENRIYQKTATSTAPSPPAMPPLTAKTKIPLPRLRFANIFSRFT